MLDDVGDRVVHGEAGAGIGEVHGSVRPDVEVVGEPEGNAAVAVGEHRHRAVASDREQAALGIRHQQAAVGAEAQPEGAPAGPRERRGSGTIGRQAHDATVDEAGVQRAVRRHRHVFGTFAARIEKLRRGQLVVRGEVAGESGRGRRDPGHGLRGHRPGGKVRERHEDYGDRGEAGPGQTPNGFAISTKRHSALTSFICSTVRQWARSRAGLATSTARAWARDTATFRRLRL